MFHNFARFGVTEAPLVLRNTTGAMVAYGDPMWLPAGTLLRPIEDSTAYIVYGGELDGICVSFGRQQPVMTPRDGIQPAFHYAGPETLN